MSVEDDIGAMKGEFKDFVTVAFARSIEDAQQYRELLNDHDIPAVVANPDDLEEDALKSHSNSAITHGVPVLVPDVLLDEASEIIADREDVDEFCVDNEDPDDDDDSNDDIGLTEKNFDDDDDDMLFGGDEPEEL